MAGLIALGVAAVYLTGSIARRALLIAVTGRLARMATGSVLATTELFAQSVIFLDHYASLSLFADVAPATAPVATKL